MTIQHPKRKIISVILAAGKGTRMQNPSLHKVCSPLEDKPVITRAIEQYSRLGVGSNCVVVGSMADQVIDAASSAFGRSFFVHQREQKGTGNAARVAADVLESTGYDGDVLIVAGDKVLEDSVITQLVDTFYANDDDLAFVVGDVKQFPSSGRIIRDRDGRILGNLEIFDIARFQLLLTLRRIAAERMMPPREVEALALSCFAQEKKAARALGPLWDMIKTGHSVSGKVLDRCFTPADFAPRIAGVSLTNDLISNVRQVNLSVYLFKASALYNALRELSADNAQGEEYLTDAIGILASSGCKVEAVPISYPEEAMAFNTTKELEEIREYYTSKRLIAVREKPRTTRLTSEWLREFETAGGPAMDWLCDIYGEGNSCVEDKRRLVASMLQEYISFYGDSSIVISRAPGRVNIMGRHVDHQGGHCNLIAIDRDTYLAIGPRDDRKVRLHNLEERQFPDREFHIDELMEGYTGDWRSFIDSDTVRARLAAAAGDWSQYIIAAILKLQTRFGHIKLRGMNIVAAGNIPIAAGLSSSSSLVVAAAEGVVHLNALDISSEEFVELCGEGEWYVGTRGGAADHAAMKFARRGQVTQVGFFPFSVTETVPFPEDYRFLICNSRLKARKTDGAKDIFNHRVACYNIGREIFKIENPRYADAVQHLRDINTRNLGVEYPQLLQMIKALPATLTRAEVKSRLSPELSEKYLASHAESTGSYQIRSVVMYGLAECERSRSCTELLARGDIQEFGRWMNISHDGDRVVCWDTSGNSWPFEPDYSDAALNNLIAEHAADSAKFTLANQPGDYSCSIPQIDRMVDLALRVKGVMGSQIAGAGLGGCIMTLVHKDAEPELERVMARDYYEPNALDPDMFTSYPVSGSGVVAF